MLVKQFLRRGSCAIQSPTAQGANLRWTCPATAAIISLQMLRSNPRWTCPATATARRATSAGRARHLQRFYCYCGSWSYRARICLIYFCCRTGRHRLHPELSNASGSLLLRRGELSYLGITARQDWPDLTYNTLAVRVDS